MSLTSTQRGAVCKQTEGLRYTNELRRRNISATKIAPYYLSIYPEQRTQDLKWAGQSNAGNQSENGIPSCLDLWHHNSDNLWNSICTIKITERKISISWSDLPERCWRSKGMNARNHCWMKGYLWDLCTQLLICKISITCYYNKIFYVMSEAILHLVEKDFNFFRGKT